MTSFLVGASTLRSPTVNQPWPGPFIMPTSCFQPLKFSPSSLIFSSWLCQSRLSGICTNAAKRSTASLQHLPWPVESGSVRLYPHSHETLHGAAPIKTGSFAEIYLGIIRANTPALTLWLQSSRERRLFHRAREWSANWEYINHFVRNKSPPEKSLPLLPREPNVEGPYSNPSSSIIEGSTRSDGSPAVLLTANV